ncbi:MAG TPA: calcium-binding protein [Allosphingosinicella sp.]|jgi:Ca2+-binding RTX toxin-like protein
MTTGTSGNDELYNDSSVNPETIDALAGDDSIYVSLPVGNTRVTVYGGDGYDVLNASGTVHGAGVDSDGGGSIGIRFGSSMSGSISYYGIERLNFSGSFYAGATWTSGDTEDHLSFGDSLGSINLSTRGGDDEVTLFGRHIGSSVDLGAGNDLFDGTAASFSNPFSSGFSASGGEGNDILRVSSARNFLYGDGGNDTLVGGGLSDSLSGGTGDDLIQGDGGDDYLNPGLGVDQVFAGAGIDTLILDYSLAGAITISDATLGTDAAGGFAGSVSDGNGNSFTFSSVERFELKLGAFADNVRTADRDDTVEGGGGNDVVRTFGGNDRIDGGTGADTMTGGLGNDTYVVDDLADVVIEAANEGFDTIETSAGSNSNYAQLYTLAANVETLKGTSATGQGVYDNGLGNSIEMGAGNDLIAADQGGDDTVNGGAGDDFVYFGGAFTNADYVLGGSGTDTVGLMGSYTLTLQAFDIYQVEKLALYSSGNAGAPNTYTITTEDQAVDAGTTLTVIAQSLLANEILTFNGAAETNAKFDIKGGRGDDSITTGSGNDIIWGNLGADSLRGGAGADSFIYQSNAESNAAARDTILDFGAGDRIGLIAIDADGNAANGDTRFTFIGSESFSNTAGELRVFQDPEISGAWRVEGDTSGDGIEDFSIIVFAAPNQVLGINEFLL